MKKLILLSTLTLAASLSTSPTNAQKITNPFLSGKKATSLGATASIPVGRFSGTDLKEGGYAQTGWGLYFDSKTTLKSGLSFISHSTYSWVPLNHKAMMNTFTKELGRRTEIKGGRHMPFLTTLGLGYEANATKKLKLGVSAQAGLLYNSFKGFDINVYDANNNVLFSDNLKFDSQFTFAYLFGVNASVNLLKNLVDLQLTADYSASKFTSSIRSYNLPPIKTSQQIQIVNVGLGFVVYTNQ